METSFDRQLAYCILRFTLGVNILLHGFVPLTHLDSFAVQVLQLFQKTPLPPQGVRLFALMLPFAQTVVGLLFTLGLWTRFAFVSGGVLIAAIPRQLRLSLAKTESISLARRLVASVASA